MSNTRMSVEIDLKKNLTKKQVCIHAEFVVKKKMKLPIDILLNRPNTLRKKESPSKNVTEQKYVWKRISIYKINSRVFAYAPN